MAIKHLVGVGRVAYITYGRNAGTLGKHVFVHQCRNYHLPKINRPFLTGSIPLGAPTPPVLKEVGSADDVKPEDIVPEDLGRTLRVRFGSNMPTIDDDQAPERDTKNFPRHPPPLYQPPTRNHIIPESWFQFFYKKTGVTGPYVFTFTFGTFLFSKEWLILEHELLTAFSTTVIFSYAVIKFGPQVRKFFTKQIDEAIASWDRWEKGNIKLLDDLQAYYKKEQKRVDYIPVIYEARKEDVAVQCEAEYRRRLKVVYDDIRRRLNYLVAVGDAQRNIAHQNMADWVIVNSIASIGPQQEREVLDSCISNLRQIAERSRKI